MFESEIRGREQSRYPSMSFSYSFKPAKNLADGARVRPHGDS